MSDSAAPHAILLTGAGGWIGGAIRRVAEARGITVIPVGRGRPVALSAAIGRATLCHAAWPDLPGSQSGATDVEGEVRWSEFLAWSLALQAAARAAGLGFVAIGSGIENVDPALLGGGYASYAARKIALRTALRDSDPASCWARLHFLFGSGEPPGRLIPAAMAAARAGIPFATGPLSRTRHWMDVDDAAALLVDLVGDPPAGDWDIAGSEAVGFADLFAMIGTAAGSPLALNEGPQGAADSGITAVPAPRPWPSIPTDIGTGETLLRRLQSYALALRVSASMERSTR